VDSNGVTLQAVRDPRGTYRQCVADLWFDQATLAGNFSLQLDGAFTTQAAPAVYLDGSVGFGVSIPNDIGTAATWGLPGGLTWVPEHLCLTTGASPNNVISASAQIALSSLTIRLGPNSRLDVTVAALGM
jgi:hypothetical protein